MWVNTASEQSPPVHAAPISPSKVRSCRDAGEAGTPGAHTLVPGKPRWPQAGPTLPRPLLSPSSLLPSFLWGLPVHAECLHASGQAGPLATLGLDGHALPCFPRALARVHRPPCSRWSVTQEHFGPTASWPSSHRLHAPEAPAPRPDQAAPRSPAASRPWAWLGADPRAAPADHRGKRGRGRGNVNDLLESLPPGQLCTEINPPLWGRPPPRPVLPATAPVGGERDPQGAHHGQHANTRTHSTFTLMATPTQHTLDTQPTRKYIARACHAHVCTGSQRS